MISPPLAKRIPTICTTIVGTELANIKDVLTLNNLNGKGTYSRLCEQWLESSMNGGRALAVSSCTTALEIAAILANIQPSDEIIVPSYTYVSSVNSFVLRGAVPVFVDLDNATMNIDAGLIEAAITPKTRVIVPVHYAGIACDMDRIMEVAKKHNLLVERAEILYEHGTNRAPFMRGEVDRYQWLDMGLNATLSELQAAFLYAQLQAADKINGRRLEIWQRYQTNLAPLAQKGYITLPHIPANTTHNANVFYVRVTDETQRKDLIVHMDQANIQTHPQFMPLHSSPYGLKNGRFVGVDRVTSLAISQILLLPVHLTLTDEEQGFVIREMFAFWKEDIEN
ncbi:uncharacterized protein ATNIH1004_005322 [Aspergillus tanneri]|uniref:Aminotransferase class I/classII domain-containing protein n=1 Tax=Aspergillus tanneri TaxID=1220188 RepID=A0A5M9MW10_9EURO|nr:uncharacterized protein ATNIH1004_005322 [Aspergillus tanneri]KAA8646647.1 hypothetical protein ATNIH1004_005322 [Aspergillus tanneri]